MTHARRSVLQMILLATALSATAQIPMRTRVIEPTGENPSFGAWAGCVNQYAQDGARTALPEPERKAFVDKVAAVLSTHRAEFNTLSTAAARASLMRGLRFRLVDQPLEESTLLRSQQTPRVSSYNADVARQRSVKISITAQRLAEALGQSAVQASMGGAARDEARGFSTIDGKFLHPARRGILVPSPLAAYEQRKLDVATLQEEIVGLPGVRPESIERARRVLAVMMERIHPDILRRLAYKKYRTYIVPRGGRVTDAPGFYVKVTTRTRGLADSQHLVIREDDLTDRGEYAASPCTFFAHEWGHAVARNLPYNGVGDILSHEELVAVSSVAQGNGLRRYAGKNPDENIAEATSAFFGVGHKDHSDIVRFLARYFGQSVFHAIDQIKIVDAQVVRKRQRGLYDELVKIWGPPHSIATACAPPPGNK